jgi:3-hydroxyacyl-CoA dehydrogenase
VPHEIPFWSTQGTQRLPRLIGLQPALEMILTGASVNATKALQSGLVDVIVKDGELLSESATKWATWAINMPPRRISQVPLKESPAETHVVCHMAGLQLPKLGSDGMMAALTAVRASSLSFKEGMRVESRQFLTTLASDQGKARRHLFFAVRAAQKMVEQAPKEHALLAKNLSETQAAVIGAGTMGSGIAMVLLQSGFTVWLVDVNGDALKKGLQFLEKTVKGYVTRRKLSHKAAASIQSRIKSTQNLADLVDCELVVEAVIENMQVKKSIFEKLDSVTRSSCLLVSNTSTLCIDEMGSALSARRRPQFAGWHFFSPAHVMKLVEIVVGSQTNQPTIALLQALSKRIGKTAVVVGNCDGFVGNRLLKPYSAETVMLLVEGRAKSTIEQVDKALLDFGMALGPFQLSDLAGNDIGYNIRRERGWVRENENQQVPSNRPSRYTELADIMVSKLGRNGQKSGKGWYDYNPAIGKGRQGLPSKEMEKLVLSYSQCKNSRGSLWTYAEIIERVMFPLVNEGFKCLEEGIARQPGDIDVIYVFGYGFPGWRGGPMYWADNFVGLPTILEKLTLMSTNFPDTQHYVPSKLLKDCVLAGLTVDEYYRRGLHKSGLSRL